MSWTAITLLLGLPFTVAYASAGSCGNYMCPPGWHARSDPTTLQCMGATCNEKDKDTCCLEGPSLVLPRSCKVKIPKDGFAPWHVYTIMKASTPKIDTAEKLLMGGQTLNMTGILNIVASKFHCEFADHEMRAVLDAGTTIPVATMSVHNSLYPTMVTTKCLLTQISMYQTQVPNLDGLTIPGLRFDYDDCPFGPAKKATLIIGLRKVPDNWGSTPGLANFFKDVCHSEGAKGGHAKLGFNMSNLLSGSGWGCWAQSADYTLMTTQRDCFEPAMVFTFMSPQNTFALFPVTDTEWEYLQRRIPKPAVPVLPTVPQADDSPSSPPVPVKPNKPRVYGHILQNRLCVAMPELGCHSFCGKVCGELPPQTGTTTVAAHVPTCTTCYDCEVPEMLYAFCCTIIAFMICQTFLKWCSGSVGCCQSETFSTTCWTKETLMLALSYSQLTQPKRAIGCEVWRQACIGICFLSFFCCLFAFTLVSLLDYTISVHWHGQEMCLKIWDWQSFHVRGWWWTDKSSIFTCVNNVCFFRLSGLFVTVWMSLWGLLCYWRYSPQVIVERREIKRIEAGIELRGGGVAGTFADGDMDWLMEREPAQL